MLLNRRHTEQIQIASAKLKGLHDSLDANLLCADSENLVFAGFATSVLRFEFVAAGPRYSQQLRSNSAECFTNIFLILHITESIYARTSIYRPSVEDKAKERHMRKIARLWAPVLAAVAVVTLGVSCSPRSKTDAETLPAGSVSLVGAGSSFDAVLFNRWFRHVVLHFWKRWSR